MRGWEETVDFISTFTLARSAGIDLDGFLTLRREIFCAAIDKRFQEVTVVALRSPPQSGKTSLMLLYADWTAQGRRVPVYLLTPRPGERAELVRLVASSCSQTPKQMQWNATQRRPIVDPTATWRLLAAEHELLIIIDGTHRLYPADNSFSFAISWAGDMWTRLKDFQSCQSVRTTKVRLLFLMSYPVCIACFSPVSAKPRRRQWSCRATRLSARLRPNA